MDGTVEVTADVRAAQRFAGGFPRVVVKPRASSGGDGVWLCNDDDEPWKKKVEVRRISWELNGIDFRKIWD